MDDGVENLLVSVRDRRMSVRSAARALAEGHLPGGAGARLDFRRGERTGLPEVVLADGKSPRDLERILTALTRASQGALLSRLSGKNMVLAKDFAKRHGTLKIVKSAGMAILKGRSDARFLRGKVAAVITAGTADRMVAEEVRVVLTHLGAEVIAAHDVGVAGLHRLTTVLKEARKGGASVYVVCAGREGALPTVIAGIVDRPVIAVPTSNGYGRGGRGEGALTAMLQSCTPLSVVNIDAGVPAALVAAQILRYMAREK